MPFFIFIFTVLFTVNVSAEMPKKPGPDFEKIYGMMDANGDGTVTKDEARVFHEKRGQRRGEWKGPKGKRAKKMGEGMDRAMPHHGEHKRGPKGKRGFYGQADANGDGSVSESEALQLHLKRFKEIDSNNDRMISHEELKAHQEKRRGLRMDRRRMGKSIKKAE